MLPGRRATELLQAGALVRGHRDGGVEVEPIELGVARTACSDVPERWLVAEAADAGAVARAEGDAALDGGGT
jgi:hypothetical protein